MFNLAQLLSYGLIVTMIERLPTASVPGPSLDAFTVLLYVAIKCQGNNHQFHNFTYVMRQKKADIYSSLILAFKNSYL